MKSKHDYLNRHSFRSRYACKEGSILLPVEVLKSISPALGTWERLVVSLCCVFCLILIKLIAFLCLVTNVLKIDTGEKSQDLYFVEIINVCIIVHLRLTYYKLDGFDKLLIACNLKMKSYCWGFETKFGVTCTCSSVLIKISPLFRRNSFKSHLHEQCLYSDLHKSRRTANSIFPALYQI